MPSQTWFVEVAATPGSEKSASNTCRRENFNADKHSKAPLRVSRVGILKSQPKTAACPLPDKLQPQWLTTAARKHLWLQMTTMKPHKITSSNRYTLRVVLTKEQRNLVWKIYGPTKVSTRVREHITNPFSKRDPSKWIEFVTITNALETMLETHIRALSTNTPASKLHFIEACWTAMRLLEELRRHEP
jgi:hypothetical protein